jgi:hypothetical protein
VKHLASGLVVLVLAASPAAAESWHSYSRSANNVFMADVDSITVTDGITSVRVATAPRAGPAGDYSHSVETYEFRCGQAARWRTAGVVEFGPDGAETGQYPEADAAWEPVRPNSTPAYLAEITCDGARAEPPIWPSIQAFVDAGRG